MKTEKPISKTLVVIIMGVVILTTSLLLARFISRYTDNVFGLYEDRAVAKEPTIPVPLQPGSLAGMPSFVDIVKRSNPSVVNISSTSIVKTPQQNPFEGFPNNRRSDDPFWEFFDKFFEEMPNSSRPRQSLGSGFVISEDGYILTNRHVVSKGDKIQVTLSDGTEYDAKMIGSDAKIDIALIKVEPKKALPATTLGDSDALEVGEWVLAIGNPFRLGHTVTAGIVSAKGRMIGQGPYDNFIQTDASINPGNSGGPLYNTKGEVVGINSAIFTAGGNGNIGIGFAIPINMAKNVLEDLKIRGVVTRGWLGVAIQEITPEMQKAFGLKTNNGALVGDVVEDSPAAKAGIERGDVIIEFAGKKINKATDLSKAVAETKPNNKLSITLIRNGKKKTIGVEIGELKDDEPSIEAQRTESKIGISVQKITPEIAQSLQLKSLDGVIVSSVDRNSSAYMAGVSEGQIIYQINRSNIKGVDDFNKAIANIKDGDTITILLRDGRSTRFLAFTVRNK
ncbi:MAG: DegQ family serine endoprotease [Nitrospinae bacterium]|nr:DegQ family serine endoprotease [Nitrospinota bacterium]